MLRIKYDGHLPSYQQESSSYLLFILIITYYKFGFFKLERLQKRKSNHKFDFFFCYSKFPLMCYNKDRKISNVLVYYLGKQR